MGGGGGGGGGLPQKGRELKLMHAIEMNQYIIKNSGYCEQGFLHCKEIMK